MITSLGLDMLTSLCESGKQQLNILGAGAMKSCYSSNILTYQHGAGDEKT